MYVLAVLTGGTDLNTAPFHGENRLGKTPGQEERESSLAV